MSIRDIITVPDEILKKTSKPIEMVGENEKKLIKDLFDTMYHSNGIGLAAVQVGILKRIIVIDISSKKEKKEPLSFINPTIKKISDQTSIYEEGCLSIPDTFIEIERPKICEVEYKPDFLIFSAGFDAHKDDPLAQFQLNSTDFYKITKRTLNATNKFTKGKVVSILEGGYDLNALATSANEHINALVEFN